MVDKIEGGGDIGDVHKVTPEQNLESSRGGTFPTLPRR